MISKKEISRMIEAGRHARYNEPEKQEYKRLSLKLMRAVAKELGCYGPGIVRFNAGGIAVCGDSILHSEWVYIMLSDGSFMSSGLGVLVRTCSGRKDYTGDRNTYYSLSDLQTHGAHGLAQFALTLQSAKEAGCAPKTVHASYFEKVSQ
jgi:hypothetical protein